MLRSLISILLVTKFLSSSEQGYYYTFTSILAITIFFELGFTGIITQYAAHEKAHLSWFGNTLQGSELNLSRLRSLLRLSIKWFSVVALLIFFVLLISGFVFFSKSKDNVNWQLPWVLMVITTSISLFFSPVTSLYTGLGKVENTTKIGLISLILTSITFFTALCLNMKLYSYAISNLVGLSVTLFWLYSKKIRETIKSIWFYPISKFSISWRKEIFPYQWKIALSWMSGYFLFQLFNPILFSTVGASAAGQMGMTQAALNGIFALSNAWFSTKIPIFSQYIAQKNYKELDKVFKNSMQQSVFVMISCFVLLIVIILVLTKYDVYVVKRFLNLPAIIILAISSLSLFVTNALATYLRCHKEEPYLILSIVSGILNLVIIYFTSKYYGIIGMVSGFLFVMIFGLIWGYFIFVQKKRVWHGV